MDDRAKTTDLQIVLLIDYLRISSSTFQYFQQIFTCLRDLKIDKIPAKKLEGGRISLVGSSKIAFK